MLLHLFLVLLHSACTVSGLRDDYVVHESRPARAHVHRRVEPDFILPIRIALAQQNIDGAAEEQLLSLSDPDSKTYGQFWTLEKTKAFFAPSIESVDAIEEWLQASGVPSKFIKASSDSGWIALDIAAAEAERLFRTEYYEYDDPVGEGTRVACDDYMLPKELVRHVDYVVPGVTQSPPLKRHEAPVIAQTLQRRSFPSRSPTSKYSSPGAINCTDGQHPQHHPNIGNCSNEITPDCVRALYNIPSGHRSGSSNALGVFEAQIYFSQEDLNEYYAEYAPYVPQGTSPDVVVIDNAIVPPLPQDTTHGLTESDLDLQVAIPLVYPQSVTYYQVSPNFGGVNITGGNGFTQASLNFLDALDGAYCSDAEIAAGNECGTVVPAKVISISYDTPEINYTASFQKRQCTEFLKLALQGHTIIAASGDFGVGSVPPNAASSGCIDSTTRNLANNGSIFSAGYPQNCPYVLSVGATQLNANDTIEDAESAMQQPGHAQDLGYLNAYYSSSGGFSNLFRRPSWQVKAVEEYLMQHDPGYQSYVSDWQVGTGNDSNIGANGGLYNRAGRGFPDVSANGAKYATIVAGNHTLEYGTSIAAPIWGSILTLINEERFAAGKGPVGFVQPVLYKHPEVFHDIVNGSNPACGSSGFSAVKGWDPITGLGTPNYPKLLEVFMRLP